MSPKRLLIAGLVVTGAALAADREALYRQAVSILGGNEGVVSRWDGPIRFAVIGHPGTRARGIVAEAAAIAGLALHFPQDQTTTVMQYLRTLESTPPYTLARPCEGSEGAPCVNFVVLVASNEEMRALARAIPLGEPQRHELDHAPGPPCFFTPFADGRRRIRQAVVYVRSDLDAAMLETCLQEEIYQAFGLFGDYTGSTLFSFNNVVAPKRITAYDRALLAALYHPDIAPGAPVNHVVSIFMRGLPPAGRE